VCLCVAESSFPSKEVHGLFPVRTQEMPAHPPQPNPLQSRPLRYLSVRLSEANSPPVALAAGSCSCDGLRVGGFAHEETSLFSFSAALISMEWIAAVGGSLYL